MVPSSAAMLAPTRPASASPASTGPSSSIMERETCSALCREARQRLAYLAAPQALQAPTPQLPHPLARYAEHAADLLERVLAAAVQAEIQAQHLGVAPLQRAQRLLDLVRQEAVHRLVFRVGEVFGDEPLDQRAIAVRIERRI